MFRNFFDHPLTLVVVVLLVVVIFGAKRLPDAARSLGRSMRIFKSEVREMKDEDRTAKTSPPLEGRVVDDAGRERVRTDDPLDTPVEQQRRGA
jgi:sec-independent protein translocase protein TatA